MLLAIVLEWLHPYFPLYFFSILGLWLVPSSLGKKRWIFPLWFLFLNLYVYSGLWSVHIPWLLLVPMQLSWVCMALWFAWKWQKGVLEINVSQWVGWSTFRLMVSFYLFVLYFYEWPNAFLLFATFSELLCGLAAPVVAFCYQKQWWLHRFLLGLWSVFGMYSAWNLNAGLVRIFWNQQHDISVQSIANYWTHFPEVWVVGFWIPLTLVIHLVVFWIYVKDRKHRYLGT